MSTILYLRNLYQPSIFTRVKAYDVPVYQCRHPEVRGYIAAFVRSVLEEMRRVSPLARSVQATSQRDAISGKCRTNHASHQLDQHRRAARAVFIRPGLHGSRQISRRIRQGCRVSLSAFPGCHQEQQIADGQVLVIHARLIGSPSQSEMRLLLQAFLTRLCVLEGQLSTLNPEGMILRLAMGGLSDSQRAALGQISRSSFF